MRLTILRIFTGLLILGVVACGDTTKKGPSDKPDPGLKPGQPKAPDPLPKDGPPKDKLP